MSLLHAQPIVIFQHTHKHYHIVVFMQSVQFFIVCYSPDAVNIWFI